MTLKNSMRKVECVLKSREKEAIVVVIEPPKHLSRGDGAYCGSP